jgi:uncharacterized membrane protein YfcA
MELYILIGAFFFIALIYSSVGFGGGSSYLALMAQPFFSLMPDTIRPTALLCNVVVVTGGTIIFYRQGKLLWKDIWPFIVMSVPMAFVGGFWKLQDDTFFIILGFTLLVVSILLWIQQDEKTVSVRFDSTSSQMAVGGRHWLSFGIGEYWRRHFSFPYSAPGTVGRGKKNLGIGQCFYFG